MLPFRPAADFRCATQTAWRATDRDCYNGMAFNVEFDLGGVTVPDEIIFGIAYNTQSYGDTPMRVNGPNVLAERGYCPRHSGGGAAGVGVCRADTTWSP